MLKNNCSFLLILLAMMIAIEISGAGEVDHPTSFTKDERAIILRNEVLARLAKTNPGAVHQVVAKIMSTKRENTVGDLADATNSTSRELDAKKNPDLDQLLRSSPEASHDLFLLLKQAAVSKGKPKALK
jgi:ribonuclease D